MSVVVSFQAFVLDRQGGRAIEEADPFMPLGNEEADQFYGAYIEAAPYGIDIGGVWYPVKKDDGDIVLFAFPEVFYVGSVLGEGGNNPVYALFAHGLQYFYFQVIIVACLADQNAIIVGIGEVFDAVDGFIEVFVEGWQDDAEG